MPMPDLVFYDNQRLPASYDEGRLGGKNKKNRS